MRGTVFLGFLLVLAASGAFAQGDVTPGKDRQPDIQSGPPAKAMGDANGNYTGQGRGNGKIGMLTPQQQAVLATEPGGAAKLRRFRTMSQNDALKLQTRLQKKWDALPEAEKDRIQKQLGGKMTQQTNGIR